MMKTENCNICGRNLGVCADGDVTMCTGCWQWHHTLEITGEMVTCSLPAGWASALAMAPVPAMDLLEAMEQAERRMLW